MSDLWYPITSDHPGPVVQVRAIVNLPGGAQGSYDAQVIASRGRPPHQRDWVEWRNGKMVPMPKQATVLLWQPQHPEKWRAPLPDPVHAVESRMWSSTMRFTLVEEAEAEDLAREMERDRAMARDAGNRPAEIEVPALPWWRDADKIRYEPKGSITPRMVEGRLLRAVATCGHGRELTIATRSFGDILAEMSAKIGQDYATSDYVPRLVPLPADIGDFEIAMGWFVALNPVGLPTPASRATWSFSRMQEVILYRSFNIPLSFDVIGSMWGMTGEGARKTYERALRAATRVANGQPAFNGLRVVDQVAALQERNRVARGYRSW